MKSVRIAWLIALAFLTAAATETWAQSSWGTGPCKACALTRRAVNNVRTNAWSNAKANGCDAGCDSRCPTGCDAGCGCDAAPACGCAARSDCGCDAAPGCGCEGGDCQRPCKVCKLVKTEIEVRSICYGVKCRDICLPGCGSGCTRVECVDCGGKGCDACCNDCDGAPSCKLRIPTGKPGCSTKIRTIKELVKYEVKKKVCGYKWVVVEGSCGGCDSCDTGCGCAAGGCDAGHHETNDGAEEAVPPSPLSSAGARSRAAQPFSRLKAVRNLDLYYRR